MSWKNVQYENGKYRTSEGGGGGGSSTFAGLDDVSFSNLENGQVPKYNSTTQKWENANGSGGGTVTDVEVDGVSVVNQQGVAEITMPSVPNRLSDLSDIDLSNIQNGQIIKWDATNNKWVNANENGHTYSTTSEQLTNDIWVDGKPIYEKTFYYASLPRSGECIFQTDIVVDKVICMNGICLWYEYAFNIPHVSWDNGLTVDLSYNTQTNDIRIHPNNNNFYTQSSDFYITVRYTKTSS